jgi:hypothetical protein
VRELQSPAIYVLSVVQSWRFLGTNVDGEAWRTAGICLTWATCRLSWVMRWAGSTGLAAGEVAHRKRAQLLTPQVHFKCLAKTERKRLYPLLVRVAHDGCFQRPLEAFQPCPGQTNSTVCPRSERVATQTDVPGRW